MNIYQNELDDFHNAIRRNGFDTSDFEISDEDISTPNPNGLHAIQIKVTVKRKSNNISKDYQSGHVTRWVVDFENDLQNGIFNTA